MVTKIISLQDAFGALAPKDEPFPTLVPADRLGKKKAAAESQAASTLSTNSKKAQADYKSFAEELGFNLSSTIRPVIKAGAGSKSQHPKGTAADYSVKGKSRKDIDALIDRGRAAGYEVIDESTGKTGTGPHIHMELPRNARLAADDNSDNPTVGGMADTDRNKQAAGGTKVISMNEAFGAMAPKGPPLPDDEGFFSNAGNAIADVAKRGFAAVMEEVKNPSRGQFVKRTQEEIDYIKAQEDKDLGFLTKLVPDRMRNNSLKNTRGMSTEEELGRVQEQIAKDDAEAEARGSDADVPWWQQFIETVGNPIDAILNESIPANVLKGISRAPAMERERYNTVRQVLQEQNIVDNPSKFPASAVEAAQKGIDTRAEKQDPTIRATWDALKQAATESPTRFAGQLTRALLADPYMVAAPLGMGAKPIQLVAGARTLGKLAQTADKVIDGAITGASLNVGIEAAHQMANMSTVSSGEVKFAAIAGGLMSGGSSLIFSRGVRAKAMSKEARDLNGKLDEALLRDEAAYEVTIESAVKEAPDPRVPTEMQQKINDMLGITSKTDRAKWIEARRKEVKASFKTDSDYADYLSFLAEERVTQAGAWAARQAEKAAEVEVASTRSAAFDAAESAKLQNFSENFDKAINARDDAEIAKLQEIAQAEDIQLDAVAKMDMNEAFEATLSKDTPAIARALNRAAKRDAATRTPKWQRGEVDPVLLTRIGLGAAGVAGGIALSEEDHKFAGGFLGGLTGLFIPGGGRVSVASRMRQSGAVGADGNILGLVLSKADDTAIKWGVDKLEGEVAVIKKAQAGDAKAFEQLFNQYMPRLTRAARSYTRSSGAKLGIEAEDVAQEAFIKAFQNLESFDPTKSEFYTWLHTIMKNRGLNVIRDSKVDPDLTSMSSSKIDYGIGEEPGANIAREADTANPDAETPEYMAEVAEVERKLNHALESLPKAIHEAVVMKELGGYTDLEISDMTGTPIETVRSRLKRGRSMIEDSMAKGYGATKTPKSPGGRQAGEIDPRLLKVGALATIGAGVGAYLNDENKLLAAGIGALAPVALMMRGKGGQTLGNSITKTLDYGTGIVSTRIKNISEGIWRRAIEHERVVLRDTHKHMKAVDPFLVMLEKMPADIKGVITRAILTGDGAVTTRLIDAINNPQLKEHWAAVRGTLDSLRDQLVHLKRFKLKDMEYFPRVVTDYDGLLRHLGSENGSYLAGIIKQADAAAIRKRGTGLTELERSLLINKALMGDPKLGGQPGFAKSRRIQEITPELQKFYASPVESLHSYIRAAVEDIERAKFFGKDLKVVEKDGVEYTNTDASIGHMVDNLLVAGKLDQAGAEELSSLLKSRFLNGERPPNEIVQWSKNMSYAGLLGNPLSAITQFGDIIIQTYTQDIRSTLSALARSLTGRKIVSMKDFGLVDHIAQEFVSTTRSSKFLNNMFKYSGFSAVDRIGKDVALNAAIIRASRLSKSENGLAELTRKWGGALNPDELKQLVKDLQSGTRSDLVNSIAFAELSRTQPITRLELPQAYLDNPNGRILYQFKTFMLKQMDVVRRDAYGEIKKGNVAKGLRNLAEFGVVLGVAGTTTDKIKDILRGEELTLSGSDLGLNMIKTFGLSEYLLDQALGVSKEEAEERRDDGKKFARTQKAEPAKAVVGAILPPVKMFDEIVRADPKAVRYIPLIGPFLYQRMKEESDE